MDSRNDRPYLSDDGQPRVRQYLVRAAKAYLCVACWVGVCALLLLYGPAAFSVPSVPTGSTHTTGVMAVTATMSGVVLSAGVATVLTIVFAGIVLAVIGRRRNQSVEEQDQSAPDATDSVEDETHA